ncbi:hypothetical protein [Crateriforma conspicua]|uniref:Uncharacterized protein n=1 Tax=Crateriforma conspicua TaxID=2527996 RepID=A0A5C5YC66_9PLAN|nr:hypothetical protein [Crateriforma conspicua]QDV65521.1 hypothetical protein Mal65_46920 [Crateriforma conspicua]TWT70912.1 hypothetical protein Pan14r_32200 [Crateriforma conspicua]
MTDTATSHRPGRRFGIQLAPLVDLLLIVVFAQFMDVRQTANEQRVAAQQSVTQLQRQREAAEQRADAAQQEQQAARQAAQRQAMRTRQAMSTIAQAFDLPLPTLKRLNEMVGDEDDGSAEVVRAMSEQVAQASPEEVVRFLVGHAELLKRAEIWHVHADPNRRVLLGTGDRGLSIRLERRGQDNRTDEMEDQLFAAYKQLPQPKGLVVILVSYSPEAVAGVYQPMIDALPHALERMRTDLPATRFEYTVLGATPLPDVIAKQTDTLIPLADSTDTPSVDASNETTD